MPSSAVLRLSARAEQGVCLAALDERVCLVLGTKASKSVLARESLCWTVFVGCWGIPHRSCSSLPPRQVLPPTTTLFSWVCPYQDGRKGWSRRIRHDLMCDGAPVAKQRKAEAMMLLPPPRCDASALPMPPGRIFMRCHGGRSSDGVFDVREPSL